MSHHRRKGDAGRGVTVLDLISVICEPNRKLPTKERFENL